MTCPGYLIDTFVSQIWSRWNRQTLKLKRSWIMLAILMGFCLFVALIVNGATNRLRNSAPVKFSMAELLSNGQAIVVLGTPIKKSGRITGSYKFNNPGGFANLFIPISGPKGSGMATSRSVKVSGDWVLTSLVLHVDGNPAPIVLINAERPCIYILCKQDSPLFNSN